MLQSFRCGPHVVASRFRWRPVHKTLSRLQNPRWSPGHQEAEYPRWPSCSIWSDETRTLRTDLWDQLNCTCSVTRGAGTDMSILKPKPKQLNNVSKFSKIDSRHRCGTCTIPCCGFGLGSWPILWAKLLNKPEAIGSESLCHFKSEPWC